MRGQWFSVWLGELLRLSALLLLDDRLGLCGFAGLLGHHVPAKALVRRDAERNVSTSKEAEDRADEGSKRVSLVLAM